MSAEQTPTPTPPETNPVAALFDAAIVLPETERAAFVAGACGADHGLRERVQALLEAYRTAGGFLPEEPAAGVEKSALELPSPGFHGTEEPGDYIGCYKLLEKIGEGGWGTVYLAEQEENIRRRVALKIIKLGMDTPSVIARFEVERQALALMDHPNIAKVIDAGVTGNGRPYFVMELVRGVGITRYCDDASLTAPERLNLFIKVCQAIQHAHQKGIIHRDIKPSNILVTVNDGEAVPKVIDFGIAKATEQKLTEKTLVTKFAQLIGTPAYMSPEQAQMTSLDIDTRSDIYSLGVLLYEMLAGKAPFDSKELLKGGLDEMRRTIQEKDPARPSICLRAMTDAEQTPTAQRRRTDTPRLIKLLRGDLDWIVMKCLEKDRKRRYPTANDLATDLQRHLRNEPVEARPPSLAYRVRKFVRRNHKAVIASAAVLVCLVLGAAFSTWFFLDAKAARQITELRDADFASRTGLWRDALNHWDAAERAGYKDHIDLGLKRAEAWIVLHERDRARAEFVKLLRARTSRSSRGKEALAPQPPDQNLSTNEPTVQRNETERESGTGTLDLDQIDLGSRRAAVLLRVGEFEMFDHATFDQGVRHVREALANRPTVADAWLAQGLLATSTPEALDAFRRALEIDPYLHSAHRHSMGLEFALGRHEELASHLRIASTLYRGDFSHGVLQASEHALLGRAAEAQAALDTLRNSLSPESFSRVKNAVHFFGKAVQYFEVENYLGERGTNGISKTELLMEATKLFLARNMGDATNAVRGRLPSLPCVEQGIRLGFDALKTLALGQLLGGTDAALEKLRESWRRHPEALFPVFAGIFLDNQQTRSGPRDLRLLALQSEMYQRGADSPSILPNLDRLARFLAVDVQEELARGAHPNAAAFRSNCVANLRLATLDQQLTPIECRSYSRSSYSLGELDLNRQFLARWERLRPGDTNLLRQRIRLELASGAYGPALKLIDRVLAANADDKFGQAEREKALQGIKKLNDSVLELKRSRR